MKDKDYLAVAVGLLVAILSGVCFFWWRVYEAVKAVALECS